jgi:probable phosphoglycerate mutase
MRLYLIRHARTLPTGPDSHAWPLAPEGEAQARALAEAPFWSEIAALYSSPEGKALATVRPAARRHGREVRPDDRLGEARRPAVWLDDYDGAVRRYLAGAADVPAGWEDAEAVRARMRSCLDELAERHRGESIAACGHGLALTLGLLGLAGAPENPFALWTSLGFGTVAVVEDCRLVVPFGDSVAIAPPRQR